MPEWTDGDWRVPFRAILDTTADGVLVCDPRGLLVLVNAEAERMFGYGPGELLGLSIDALVPESVRAHHHRNIERYVDAPRVRLIGASLLELHGRRKDGSEFPVEISLSPFQTERGLLVIGGVRDISERKHLETELRAARAAAEAASAAKSEFLASMSHELRTPLTAILGFAQLLEQDPKRPLDGRSRERLGYILRGGEHLLRLIDDVLDLSRIEDGRLAVAMQPVAVDEVVDEVARTLEPMAAHAGVRIAVAPPPRPLPAVLADRTRLVQILMNFGTNAVKYGRLGGHVTLQIERRAGLVRVSVADDGIGIPDDMRGKVFEPFFRAGQETGPIEGTGIGLTISRRLAALMGGTLDFTSVAGVGSTFWIELPAQDALAPAAPTGFRSLAASPLAPGPQRFRVLYIEDNPSSAALMHELVEGLAAIALTTVPTAEQGLAIAADADLILVDIHLPGISGWSAVAALRAAEATRAIPVIGLSAAAFAADGERARGAGFDRYLTKPVQIGELARVFEELLLRLPDDAGR